MPSNFGVRGALGALGVLASLVVAHPAQAEQFVLLDATFDYTWDDAMNAKPNKSHFYVNEGNFLNKARPKNWMAPVDYRNGKLHVRTEVFVKPAGDQQVGWTLCYIANVGDYGCADTNYYKSTGVFERETSMTDFWQNDTIQWDQGIKQVDLIYAIDDSGSGHITNYPNLKDLVTPTSVRITMVQVSAGSDFDPAIITPTPGSGGSGAGGAANGGSDMGGLGGMLMMPGSAGEASGGTGLGGFLSMSGGAPTGGNGGASTSTPLPTTSGASAITPSAASTDQDSSCAGSHGQRPGLAVSLLGVTSLLLRHRRRGRSLI